MHARNTFLSRLLTLLLCAGTASAADLTVTIAPSIPGAMNVPVSTHVSLPEELEGVPYDQLVVRVTPESGGAALPGQIIRTDAGGELWFILPETSDHASTWTVSIERGAPEGPMFAWSDDGPGLLDLSFDGRRVMRYVHAFDDANEDLRHAHYKPYYQMYDAEGAKPITKGPGGLYTHHRGIFLGWNHTRFDGRSLDFWHMPNCSQQHSRTIEMIAGPVLARLTTAILWNDQQGAPVIIEQRTATLYRQPEPMLALLDFSTILRAADDEMEIELNGDPEHAGCQFRSHNGVAEGEAGVKARYVFHEQGIDPKKDFDLPWAAMTIGPAETPITVQHMNHPANPSGSIYSAYRDYGRFGAFPATTIAPGGALLLNYRFAIRGGDCPDRAEFEAARAAYADPPKAEVSAQ
jgi:hypothetical protein